MKLGTWMLVLASCACAQSFEGTWQGTLNTGAMKLRIAIHISRNGDAWTSTLDSIDQGANGIPVASTKIDGASLHLDIAAIHGSYDGKLNGEEISGTLTQGVALPLSLKRVDKVEVLRRPQEPKPPFPYQSIDVSYEDKLGKLAGTLTVPAGAGPFPAALMITGSGAQDRNEELFGHKPFWVIADDLSRRGIAVLRLDDRGVGGSSGQSSKLTLDDMTTDVLAGVAFLKARKEIDPKRIGLIGHSEGGIVAPLAASRSSDVAFVVMLAGTGVTGEQVLYKQAELINKAAGAPETAIAMNRAIQEMIIGIARETGDEAVALEKFRDAWFKKYNATPSGQLEQQVKTLVSPEIRSFTFFDPATSLSKVKCPVLALNGSRDLQVPPSQNLPAIKAALTAAGNKDFEIIEVPGLNHLFQKCDKCTVAEYGTLEETFSPDALKLMGDWIVRHTARPSR